MSALKKLANPNRYAYRLSGAENIDFELASQSDFANGKATPLKIQSRPS